MQTDDPQIVATRRTDQLPKLNVGFAWALSGRQLLVVNILKDVPTGLPPTGNVKATPACIIPAGQREPLKLSTSGWKSRSVSELLDNERWTGLVRAFAKAVGFAIPRSIRDTPKSKVPLPENDGRYAACHAEKKLGLYFLNLQIRHAGISFQDALEGKLREARLPLHRRRARIYLGHRPCKNCRDFLKFIRRRTGIDVRWSKCPLFNEHKRDRTFQPGMARTPTRNPTAISAGAMAALGEDSEDDKDSETETLAHQQQQQHTSQDVDQADAIMESVETDNNLDNLDDLEDIIETLPVGNVTRPRQPRTPGEANKKDPATRDRDREAMPPPALDNAARISVRSSPSPSISLASVADSTIADRRMRYPTYSSPSRREDSVAPPSVWGGRSKPPVTACLEPPDEFWGACGDDPAGMPTASPSQPSYGQSYFFGTPSGTSSQNGQDEDTEEGFVMINRPSGATARAPDKANAPPGSHIPDSMLQICQFMRAGQRRIDSAESERQDSARSPSSPCVWAEHVHRETRQRQVQRQIRRPARFSNHNRTEDAAPLAPIYIPPYLRRLQRPANTDRHHYHHNGRAAGGLHAARSPTPVVDLTDTTNNGGDSGSDDAVEFVAAKPSCDAMRTASTSSPAARHPWHPPMRPVGSAEPDVQILGSSALDGPRGQQTQRARHRGVAVRVRRRRGRARNRFPDLRTYHYTGGLEGV